MKWNEKCDQSFKKLKELITTAPVMAAPNFKLPFIIQTDASAVGLGAVLLQETDGKLSTIMYASRALSKQEKRYSAVERECLAIVWAIEKMRPYVECTKFKVLSDQRSLQWLKNAKDPSGRLTRWSMRLQQFDFSVVYYPGKGNLVADALSRLPEMNGESVNAVFRAVESPTLEQIREAQREDPILGTLVKSLETGERPSLNKIGRKVEKLLPYCVLQNGLVYQKFYSDDGEKLRLLVPKQWQRRIIAAYHDSLAGGHLGAAGTLGKIQGVYTWRGMSKDVAE